MQVIRIDPTFEAWRAQARALLHAGTPPDELLWEDGREEQTLFESEDQGSAPTTLSSATHDIRIPKAFMALAKLATCHRSPKRWSMLYRVAWRMTHGQERHLLSLHVDHDIAQLEDWASAVRRDRHKMKAFVRFRKVGEHDNGREQFVAWFEPDNPIVELTAPFFAKRFASMDWSILTPWQCAHWDGQQLSFSAGVSRHRAPDEDTLEDYWRSYYAHIFNPARLKIDAMLSEMPKKYWKNLPEAPLINELTLKASRRSQDMVSAAPSERAHVSYRIPKGVPAPSEPAMDADPAALLSRIDALTLEEWHQLGQRCHACPLHERATRTVFGQGPRDAEIMIVGEQPGDTEDLQGRPFVGPAGELLDEALTGIGLDRKRLYLTNAVKHFKWKRAGKRRLHQTPSANERHLCRPWLLGEIHLVRPRVLICLGSTAAKSLIDPNFAISSERGLVSRSRLASIVIATWHPSYFLRLPNGDQRELELAQWVADLSLARKHS